jgi:hypothetical protein
MPSTAGTALQAEQLSAPPVHSLPPAGIAARLASALSAHPLIFIQCLGLALALIDAAECHLTVTRSVPNAPIVPSIVYGLVLWYWWGLEATLIWKFAQRSGKDFFSLSSTLKYACVGALLAGLHLWVLQRTLEWWKHQWFVSASTDNYSFLNLPSFRFEFLLYGFIFGLTGVIHLQLASQREKMRTLSLERQLSAAHLRALQMQIEPHFLFNTLNAITSLVEQARNDQALQTLQNLNSILQTTLRRSTPEKVPLAQELQLIDDYLSIEVTRFADRLCVDMNIDRGSLDAQLPCFLLQPIVENAIRHGISRCEQNSFIKLRAEHREARLHLVVRNTAPQLNEPTKPGHGIGLKNTQERLALFYGDNYEFRAGRLESGGFEVSIDIPYERAGQ